MACYVGGIATPNALWVLRPEDNYCYGNLPDLTPHIRAALVGGSADLISSMLGVFLVHQKKAVASSSKAHRCAMVNLLHGLLLGLYPFNVRKGSFEMRVAIAGAVRGVMVGDQAAFMESHPSLMSLSMVEYLMNVLPDVCPVEYALLERSAHCRMVVNNICEQFRVSLVQPLVWSDAEAVASGLMPSITRQLKLQCRRLKQRQTVYKVNVPWDIEHILSLPVVRGVCGLASVRLLDTALTFDQLVDVENVWRCICLSPLPSIMVEAQLLKLEGLASSSRLTEAISCMHMCVKCVFQRRVGVLEQTFGLDCVSHKLVCTHCRSFAMRVTMVGRVLRVMGVHIRLCHTCMRPCPWSESSNCQACRLPPPAPAPVVCEFCQHHTVVSSVDVVDLDSMRLRPVHLCYKHAKNCVLVEGVKYDMASLEREMWSSI